MGFAASAVHGYDVVGAVGGEMNVVTCRLITAEQKVLKHPSPFLRFAFFFPSNRKFEHLYIHSCHREVQT